MYFFTATINTWKKLLQNDELKDVIIDSLYWLDNEKKAATHAFVIMPNHIHLLWTSLDPDNYDPAGALLSYTAHQFKKKLKAGDPVVLNQYISTQADREYHFWERRPRSIPIANREIALQKMDYIHHNPLQEHWRLSELPELYKYSSAAYYMLNDGQFAFIKHYGDFC